MIQEFKQPKAHLFKALDKWEYAKTGIYLKQLDEEVEVLKKRLAFLNKQRRAVVEYRLRN